MSSTLPLASVVIANWNGASHLRECLDSLRKQTVADRMEIIVVDNGSTDGSLDLLANDQDAVRLLRNERNVGFAAACNQGIAASTAPYVALLNNDAVVDRSWLEQLIQAMCGDDDVGSCTSKILSYYQRDVFDNTGHVVFADGLTRGRGRLEKDRGQYEKVEEVFCASGCAVLLRRAMLEDVGLLDERFFAYCEDADLGFRARLRGWRCLYVPGAIAYHKFSAGSDAYSEFKALHVERNRLWLAVKNLPLPLLLVSPLFTLARYFWQAVGALTLRGAAGQFAQRHSRLHLVRVLLRAQFEAMRKLPEFLRTRRAIQARRTVSARDVRSWLRRYGVSARAIALMD